MNSPLVSVALRAYNQEKQVRKAIESILAQALDFPIEIVCGVDKSQDQTLQVVQEISQTLPSDIEMRVISHNANGGGVNNLIAILGECKGKYIAWLDADDYWIDSKKVVKEVAILESSSSVGVVYTDDYIDSIYADNGLQKRRRGTLGNDAFSQLLLGNYITSETVIFRASLLQYIDWEEMEKYPADDWFMWLEMSVHTHFYHLKEHTAAATITREISEDIPYASLEYAKKNLGLQKYYMNKYPDKTNLSISDIEDAFYDDQLKTAILMSDYCLAKEAVTKHTSPQSIKKKLYYKLFNNKFTFELYMLYRKLKGKNNKTPLERYFY